MENNETYIKLKKLAVVLYEEFNGNQSAIMNELVKNNLKLTPEQIEEKSKGLNLDDYVLMGDKEYANILKDIENNDEIIYIYKKVVKH